MVVHTCPRCKKDFNLYGNYIKHVQLKKTPCVPPEEKSNSTTCEYCNKTLSNRSNYKKHLKICLRNIENKNDSTQPVNKIKNNNIKIINNGIINHGTINNTTINNFHFKIYDYGTEDFDEVNLSKLFDNGSIFLNLIEDIHCNPDNPEYHNILITDKNRNGINIFRQDKWLVENKNIIMQDLINRGYLFLNSLKEKLIEKYKEKVEHEIDKFINHKVDSQYEDHNRMLKQRINNVIYNNKNMIKNSHKLHIDAKKLRDQKYLKKKCINVVLSDSEDSTI